MYHADITTMNELNKIMDCDIRHISMGTARQTRIQSDDNQLAITDGMKLVRARLPTLAWRMHILKKIHKKGAVSVGLEESASFVDAMSAITDSCRLFSKEEILRSYREFLVIL